MQHPLRTYRKTAGLTLADLGKSLGVTKGFLSRIESYRQVPSMHLAAKIAEVTNGAVTPNDFVAQANASTPTFQRADSA